MTLFYVFFPKTETSIQIPLGSLFYLPLEPEHYGIADWLESKSMSVDELLEKVGAVVNNVIEYDFEKIDTLLTVDIEECCDDSMRDAITQERAYYKELQRTYQPSEYEIMKGICSDAGKQIRDILFTMDLNEKYGIVLVSSNNRKTTHDTTLVFNKETGRWSVVNSKSPIKSYTLVPKEKLVELGCPYVK